MEYTVRYIRYDHGDANSYYVEAVSLSAFERMPTKWGRPLAFICTLRAFISIHFGMFHRVPIEKTFLLEDHVTLIAGPCFVHMFVDMS